jgi:hypothetical protein
MSVTLFAPFTILPLKRPEAGEKKYEILISWQFAVGKKQDKNSQQLARHFLVPDKQYAVGNWYVL